MPLKFIAIAALITVTRGGAIGYIAQPQYSLATVTSFPSVSSPEAADVYAKVAARPAALKTKTSLENAAPDFRVAAPVPFASPYTNVFVEKYAPAHYQFSYSVNDPHTGDNKNHEERREGGFVNGRYSLIEADGSKRTVEYTADSLNGFNAVVHNEPVKAAAQLVYSDPSYANYASPAVAKVAYSPAIAVSYSSVGAPAAHSGPSYH